MYFGSLHDVASAAANALRPGGRFVFTVEALPDEESDVPYSLAHHGRYRHARRYLEGVLADAGLRSEIASDVLRFEAGDPVEGLVVRATKDLRN